MDKRVTVVGAGLAGSEAAWQLANRGIDVTLVEMKPHKRTPAHESDLFGELVCSNSLRAAGLANAPGLLKEELRRFGSLIMLAADKHRVEAGGALAVDRVRFAEEITEHLREHPRITIEAREVCEIPEGDVIIATGPLTSDPLADAIARFFGDDYSLSFYDAAAPIVTRDSIDMSSAFFASRYDKGGDDYINCPLDKESYEAFWEALCTAKEAEVHGFEDSRVFEGCMPVEVMARRGKDTLRYGPMKPRGITDPKTGRWPFAVVQLRRDDAEGTLYNLVGFQTHLLYPEQRRVFRMIPALANAEFMRYGSMHRNTYIDSPRLLDRFYRANKEPRVIFAGQITGVEGYIESTASGLYAAINLANRLNGLEPLELTNRSAIGALALYASGGLASDLPEAYGGKKAKFQPSNINFGIMEKWEGGKLKKQDKNQQISARALEYIDSLIGGGNGAQSGEGMEKI